MAEKLATDIRVTKENGMFKEIFRTHLFSQIFPTLNGGEDNG
jgi:hypothetical protein